MKNGWSVCLAEGTCVCPRTNRNASKSTVPYKMRKRKRWSEPDTTVLEWGHMVGCKRNLLYPTKYKNKSNMLLNKQIEYPAMMTHFRHIKKKRGLRRGGGGNATYAFVGVSDRFFLLVLDTSRSANTDAQSSFRKPDRL
jgi:hypothetical protein